LMLLVFVEMVRLSPGLLPDFRQGRLATTR
jgi:hypothetical protein